MKMTLLLILIFVLYLCPTHAQKNIDIPKAADLWLTKQLKAAKKKQLLQNYNQENFFTDDTARLVGYLKGYNVGSGFKTGLVHAQNIITYNEFPIVIKVYTDGRFEGAIPVSHPKILSLDFKDFEIQPYVEPGQTLAMIIDWPAFAENLGNKKSIWYRGPAAGINNELNMLNITPVDNDKLIEDARKNDPVTFKNKTLWDWDEAAADLERQFRARPYLRQTQAIARNTLKEQYAVVMYTFLRYRYYLKRADTVNQILKVPAASDYYNFLQRFDLNDKGLLIPKYFSALIDGYQHSAPFDEAQKFSDGMKDTGYKKALRQVAVTDSLVYSFYKHKPSMIDEIAKVRNLCFAFKYDFPTDSLGIRKTYYTKAVENNISNRYFKKVANDILKLALKEQSGEGYELPDTRAAAIFKKIIAPYKGKVLFVNFWATSCTPCVHNIKNYYDIRMKYKHNPDLDFLFITSANESPRGDYERFVKEQDLTNTCYLNIDDYRYLKELFRFNGIPKYITVNQEGKILNDGFNTNTLGKLLPKYAEWHNGRIQN